MSEIEHKLCGEFEARLADIIRQKDAEIERLKDILRELEYIGGVWGNFICYICGDLKATSSHLPDCRLMKALKGEK